ncbi:3',5'-cyclic-AMP phosphodiesterase [Thiolapillus brandeum]|uniref:Calcineurin phosphoesterase domain protein n=1 Tax=Thiolapillus brandeum TaxID=1076588 RepID=A0A7U6GKI7_9GAMM|nr:3',5'-cyclic-AMP phosphodiesterase [Thiolapillus brandeum]BAO45289.1 calcineurin phosphoesterase domain protein [Thiolapillus brandeum]
MNTVNPGAELHLLQISDCHLYADPEGTLLGLNTLDSLQQVLHDACQDTSPELVIVTGDLVHDGSRTGYQNLAHSLKSAGCPGAAIPGNHDHVMTMQNTLEKRGIRTSGHMDMGNWRLVLLNSQVLGREHGHLSQHELEILDHALQDAPSNVLVFLHHQPIPIGSRWLDKIGLDNGEALLSRVQDDPRVKGICWGHVHQSWEGRLGHLKLMATPSTCIQFSPGQPGFGLDTAPPGWRDIILSANGRIRSEIHHLRHMPQGLIADSAGY